MIGILSSSFSASNYCVDDYEFPINATSDFRVFLMADRGDCSFKQKTLIAEKKGFKAVVFIQDETHIFQDISTLIPADDGIGGEAHIPSVVISHYDGRRLRRAMKKNKDSESIIAELSWIIPMRANLRLDMWLNPASKRDIRMLTSLRPLMKTLYASSMNFRFMPHFNFFALSAGTAESLCLDEMSEFCSEGGRDVAKESLRVMCIRNWAFNDAAREAALLDYMVESHACSPDGYSPRCTEAKMKLLNIDMSEISKCMQDSTLSYFLLQLERASKAWSSHAVRINGFRYDGEYSADGVRLALCSAIKEELRPNFCRPVAPSAHENTWLITMVSAAVAVTLLVGYFVFRGLKQQLLEEIHSETKSEVRWAFTERNPLMIPQLAAAEP
jgi:hypothetical protein